MRTFVIIKPDAVERGLVGEIIKRFEQKLLKIVRMELRLKTAPWCAAHYSQFDSTKADHREIYARLQDGMIYKPLIGIVLAGEGVVDVVRKIVGGTDSIMAAPGTIRGDFGARPVHHNLVHAADSVEAAEREWALFYHNATDWE